MVLNGFKNHQISGRQCRNRRNKFGERYKDDHFLDAIIDKGSSFSKLQKIVAYIPRFVGILRGKKPSSVAPTVAEDEHAEKIILRRCNILQFPKQRGALIEHNKSLSIY